MVLHQKTLSVILILSLIASVFFVFAIHTVGSHFCPLGSGGLCGLAGGLEDILGHLASLNGLLSLVLPLVYLGILFLANSISTLNTTLDRNFSFVDARPRRLSEKELSWLVSHLNSPNLR
ncbi:MAG: hypothetical protein HYW37_00955 [Candidatus Colwellbacteria bacterium]|nr:hypothetical protein [Candidatus Colwellbacteria bacterium]